MIDLSHLKRVAGERDCKHPECECIEYTQVAKPELAALIEALEQAIAALRKVDDPMTHHHWEEDAHTRAGCFQFVAHEALKSISALIGKGEGA